MSEKYIYGNRDSLVEDASGVSGVLTKDITGEYFFRVYNPDKTFTDYDLRHDDLPVTINSNAFASFYSFDDEKVLDHSPGVLGLKKK